MDRRRIELQIRAIVVSYRVEERRRDGPTMEEFRARARSILDGLEEEARRLPELEARLVEVRGELDAAEDLNNRASDRASLARRAPPEWSL
jgi:hypothetical protein